MVCLYKVDEDTIEYTFETKNDKNIALTILKRYIKEFKNTNNPSTNITIRDKNIRFNKRCEIKKPILKISDFYDKEDRLITCDISFK